MVFINPFKFTTWESPGPIESLAGDLRDQARRFNDHIGDAHSTWGNLANHYRGDSDAELVAGLNTPNSLADDVKTYGDKAARQLESFCDELTALRSQREDLSLEVQVFNAEHLFHGWSDLEPHEQLRHDQLIDQMDSLQKRYESIISVVVGALGGLELNPLGPAPGGRGYHSWGDVRSPVTAGLAASSESYVVAAGLAVIQGQRVTTTTTTNRTYRTEFTDSGKGAARATAETGRTRARNTTSIFGSELWQGKNGILGLASRDAARSGQQMKELWKERKSVYRGSPLRGLQWSAKGFANNFLEGLPLAGLTKEMHQARDQKTVKLKGSELKGNSLTVVEESTRVKEKGWSKGLRYGGRAFGVAGTVATAGLTFKDERESNVEDLRRENPGMSEADIKKEANFDAAANTAGQVGASVAAGAAAGAAIGSIIPVGGTIVGGVAGALVGVAAAGVVDNVKILPDMDGDGERESAGQAVGHMTERASNVIRDKVGNGINAVRGFFGGD
ncbi:hypothetical protein [Kocuria sp.]|uniref:hypothetical protein n=1 Tax=Kocuria sp. TaxID=1871328 RepID=UPI0026DEC24F|nr:hypothetical protein [Kocuria sp.]MDO5618755.1 hypothetical protein [Kocuria sp.]